ncbi:acetyl-CoA synthetase-like protein [Phanerochaete sordida]|uniref:Acetyl-CoA synthetase-like protein n=1 Tax=Phanerochaete sordida TaxID=48140 RepID=A0A9P3GDA7_9APHY|nr:acetyl-CoA synthetase-like protein [Phanerochaete sordida]
MASPCLPPIDGSLCTLIALLDFNAAHNADWPYVVLPEHEDSQSLQAISFAEMARASHHIAHLLRPGREGPDEVVAIVLNTDMPIYILVVLGLLRAGLVAYPMSPRNSPEAICHMLQSTSCTRIISQDSLSALTEKVRAEMALKGVEMRVADLASLEPAFDGFTRRDTNDTSHVEPYPPPTAPDALQKPALYLHSSGSTGFPKSILSTHERLFNRALRNATLGSRARGLRYAALGLPPFHTMGLVQHVLYPLLSARAAACFALRHPAPPVVPHARNVLDVARACKCDGVFAVPAMLEAWAREPASVAYLRTLQIVSFGGGPLPQAAGDALVAAGVRVAAAYGGTEFSSPTATWDEARGARAPLVPDADWQWVRWSARASVRMVAQGDGTFELVVCENEGYLIPVYNVPGEKAYATADLFEPHPTKEGLWRIVGRRDDVIILSNGEKIVPLQQEDYINGSPLVRDCLMFGREREQAGLLVEPAPEHTIDPNDERALASFRNKIWPFVETANGMASTFAKIFKEMILVTDPSKPFPRAAKGTVQRKAALLAYAEEIDRLYETVADSSDARGILPPKSWKEADLVDWLSEHAMAVNGGRAPPHTANLFEHGFDSLGATFFRNRVIAALRGSGDTHLVSIAAQISPNFVFEHPTIQDLASVLGALVDPSSGSRARLMQPSVKVEDIVALIAKYTAELPTPENGPTNVLAVQRPVVLLTGSTGNIGSHILAYLLAEKNVAKVYALNRPSANPGERLKAAFAERLLPADLLDKPKAVSLTGDVTLENFGLADEQYDEVISSVTHIIHNAWTVNFNLSLQSYEDQIAGVRMLVEICASAPRPVRLLVTSSVGMTSQWDPNDGPVPEHPLPDPAVATNNGYSASKYVVEQILDRAHEMGFKTTAVRMGQACGPEATGAWGTTEWVPILVRSSVALGCFPDMTGPVNWVPLDAIGEMYVDWVNARDDLPALVNVVHPRPTSWDVVLAGLRAEVGGNVPVIPLDDWVSKLEALSTTATAEDLTRVPALKLLRFFRSIAASRADKMSRAADDHDSAGLTYATAELQRSSVAMRRLQPMSEAHAHAWVRYWRDKGWLPQTVSTPSDASLAETLKSVFRRSPKIPKLQL